MYDDQFLREVSDRWRREGLSMNPPDLHSLQGLEAQASLPVVPLQDSSFDPRTWTCSVCGKVRLRELLHSKAIMGRQQLVCAPSCLGAERRANAR